MTYTQKQKQEYVTEIKTTVGCKNCGKEGPPRKLHLHHIDGERKVDRVSQMVNLGYSLEEVKNEIRKCEVLCDKCHGTHHHASSKQECIDALREVAEKLDKSPTYREYKEHRKDKHPSYWTIQKKFGSWNNGKEAAGLSAFAHGSGNKTPTVDNEGQLSFDQFAE